MENSTHTNKGDVIKDGYLTKQSIGSARNWKKRYFIMRSNALYYYEDRPKDPFEKPKGIIELNERSVVRPSAVMKNHAFEVVCKPKTLRVHADSKIEANQWMAAIKSKIDEMKASKAESEGGVGLGEIREGYLTKRAMKSGRNWKKRYFLLRDGRISWWENKPKPGEEKDHVPKGVMELSPDSVIVFIPEKQSQKKYTFEVTSGLLALTLAADSAKEMEDWVRAMDQHVLIKSGMTDQGHLEVMSFLRSAGIQEYARKFIDEDLDELLALWTLAQREVIEANNVISRMGMTTMEGDRFKHAIAALKKTKRPIGRADRMAKSRKPAFSSVGLADPIPPPPQVSNRLYSWGDNTNGQLGLVEARTGAQVAVPTWCDALRNKSMPAFLAAGETSSACITQGIEANLYTWGAGPLGLGPDKINTNRPFLVTALRDVPIRHVAVGSYHMVCCTKSGDVYSWGGGDLGQLGLGDALKGTGNPQQVIGVGPIIKEPICMCAASETHTLLLSETGAVFSFGSGANGKLGLGDTQNRFEPKRIQNLSGNKIGQIACGDEFSLAVNKSGSAAFWWGNVDGGPSEQAILVPNRIENFTNRPISIVAAGGTTGGFVVGVAYDEFQDALLTSSVFTFGSIGDLLGQADDLPHFKPALVDGCEGHGIVGLSISRTHAAALTGDGRLLMFGKDDCGQLGSSYMVDVKTPMESIKISGFRYISVACGESFTLSVCVEDPSVKEGNEAPGTPLAPPPPPPEVLAKAKHQDDQLSLLLAQLGGLSEALDKPRADSLADIPPPPEEVVEPKPREQKQIGGVRILPPGSTDLGNGWLRHTDKKSGKFYYENTQNGLVQWTAP